MTPTIIKVSKEFPGLWLGMESSIAEGEDPTQAYLDSYNSINEAYEKIKQSSQVLNDWIPEYSHGIKYKEEPPKVINRLYERMEVEIDKCTSLEELSAHKEFCGKHPDLMPFYMNKLKELSKSMGSVLDANKMNESYGNAELRRNDHNLNPMP